jgi:uncharacterized protein YqgV (UPF0045/DUF77 family)
MRVTAELSLYPLQDEFIPPIQVFIRSLEAGGRIEVRSNQLSTQLRGELDDVMTAVRDALDASFSVGGPQALVAKFLNADLPLDEPPDLGSDG